MYTTEMRLAHLLLLVLRASKEPLSSVVSHFTLGRLRRPEKGFCRNNAVLLFVTFDCSRARFISVTSTASESWDV